jgi:hypothetical protein
MNTYLGNFRLNLPVFLFLLLLANACSSGENIKTNKLFLLHEAKDTGIDFINELSYTEKLNPYTFRNFYNGGGVGLGDFDKDGLLDIFFSGNLVANKLYLNKGNFKFNDISIQAGIGSEGVWTTGVSIVDINADGWLDIYICKSGPPGGANRHNELFINDGNGVGEIPTFTEMAKDYRLDDQGLSTHAAFFDYDKDGDLDLYLLNNSLRSIGGYDLRKDQRKIPDPDGGNKLYRNEGTFFTDVTLQAGIYSSAIGFGLGVTIGDINKDGWQDIYVSNDFFEKDYLYINNKNGSFSEKLEDYLQEISMGSMGADLADINNDALPEIFVTEMLPESDDRLKTTAQFEKWDKYQTNILQGYYQQFSRNSLQLNNGPNTNGEISFSEISRFSGVHATDWSWGALIFDMDLDGLKDIFVANGIYKDLLNQDYVNFIGNPDLVRQIILQKKQVIKQLIDSIPSNKIPNFSFKNQGSYQFTNKANDWGLDLPSHSNGSAYGDLDNDGDLDLVINNVNMPAFIYENKSTTLLKDHHFLTINLVGEGLNTFALGSKVNLYSKNKIYYQELAPMRGFMSSVDYRLNFGMGLDSIIDSLIIEWPDDRQTKLYQVETNKFLSVFQKEAKVFDQPRQRKATAKKNPLFFQEPIPKGVVFKHVESNYVDFDKERLRFNMISNEGPCTCSGDFNKDGLDDFYIGGARGQAGRLWIQNNTGQFKSLENTLFDEDKDSEDTGCLFFDADNDGFPELYVTSGSNEVNNSSLTLMDRLYVNKKGKSLVKSQQILPSPANLESTTAVKAADFDSDGDLDLFVGGRVSPNFYGQPVNSYLLQNDGKGNFNDVTSTYIPDLKSLGMVTDAAWLDYNMDGKIDLVIVGEWMPVRLFVQQNRKFIDQSTQAGLQNTNGWYHSISVGDVNKDGFPDIVLGNHGLNSRFKASVTEPIRLYINDFDNNGTVEQILTRYYDGKELPLHLRTDLVMQLPYLKKKYLRFSSYKNQGISDIFTKEQISSSLQLKTFNLSSSLLINMQGKKFIQKSLPAEAQFSPIYTLLTADFNKDGHLDILLGGNQSKAKPETGIYQGSYGLLLKGHGNGSFSALKQDESGLFIKGEMRSLTTIRVKNKPNIIVGKNNDFPVFLSY